MCKEYRQAEHDHLQYVFQAVSGEAKEYIGNMCEVLASTPLHGSGNVVKLSVWNASGMLSSF